MMMTESPIPSDRHRTADCRRQHTVDPMRKKEIKNVSIHTNQTATRICHFGRPATKKLNTSTKLYINIHKQSLYMYVTNN